MKLPILACLGVAGVLTACSSGAGPNYSTVAPQSTTQRVSGTLRIATGLGTSSASRAHATSASRKPLYVSTATENAALFIDGAATPAGTTSSCAPSVDGSGCTISWSANLTAPASHTFDVETDTGSGGSPANTVLAEGQKSYAIVFGTNALSAMSLNGVVVGASFTVTGCSASGNGTTPSTIDTCAGNVTLSDAAGEAIVYGGSAAGPLDGQNPTSGNVYDNDGGGPSDVTFEASTGSEMLSGTGQAPYSLFNSGLDMLTVVAVNASGTYAYQVTCEPNTSLSFGIDVGGGDGPSGDVTAAELGGLTVSYPAAGVVTIPTAPQFNCSNGAISSATGTLPIN